MSSVDGDIADCGLRIAELIADCSIGQ